METIQNLNLILNYYNIHPKGIIVLGANTFQEKQHLVNMGYNKFLIVEALPNVFERLKANCADIDADLYNVAVSNEDGELEMYVSSNDGLSSSLLEPKEHKELVPSVAFNQKITVHSMRIENMDFDRSLYNTLMMDLQGNELNALHGDQNILDGIDVIFTEVNFINLYKDCALFGDLSLYLEHKGFKVVWLGDDLGGWSDAIFVKNKYTKFDYARLDMELAKIESTIDAIDEVEQKLKQIFAASEREFSEKGYLDKNLDVKQAIESGVFVSGRQHYDQYGIFENRQF